MVALHDLPVELLLDNLLPLMDLRDLFALAATSKFYTILINDDTFWQRKLEAEYNFTSRETARTNGWKAIYRGMRRPQVYVWGATSNGRLGRGEWKPRELVASPVHPALKPSHGVGIVALAAGGWSFHAIDAKGRLYAWGQLDAERVGIHVDGFADKSETALLPIRVNIDAKLQYVSCGRAHALAFDSASRIWHFSAWGAALRLVSPAFDGSTPDTTVIQLEAGWDSGTALTAGGSAYAWWHGRGDLARKIDDKSRALAQQNPAQVRTVDGERVVPCSTADIAFDPVHLPALPALPKLGESDGEVKLVKIAAADAFIVGLTNAGHVLKLDAWVLRERQDENGAAAGRPLPAWEYLPLFSEASHILSHPAFSGQGANAPAPTDVSITHISAHFHTFFAYSTGASSVVLQGDDATVAGTSPTVLPSLQHRDVISVVLGDYHWGALTANGKLLTWGQFSAGALGLGDPFSKEPGPGGFIDIRTRDALRRLGRTDSVIPVEEPTEVDFGRGKFVVAATAAGWHTGALVLDLENLGEESEEVQQLVEQAESSAADDLAQWQSPPFIPGGGGGLYPMPIIGRGRGGLIGRQQPHLPVQPRQPQLQGGSASGPSAPPRGALHFRVGYAGRGAHIPGLVGRGNHAAQDAGAPSTSSDGTGPGESPHQQGKGAPTA